MTKQEQIEEMRRELYCAMSKVNGIAFSSDLAEALYNAGYGNVSEYKAERELLGSQIKVLKQRLNNKCIEVYNLNRDYTNSFERLKAQEREIERLKELNKVLENDNYNKELNLESLCDEIDRLESVIKEKDRLCFDCKKSVKEFAEKIKAKSYVNDYCREVVEIDKIDELLKEYENGKDKD